MDSKIYLSSNPKVQELSKKVGDKCVRVLIKDGREYLGIFSCIDKTGTLFLLDALEFIDINAGMYFIL